MKRSAVIALSACVVLSFVAAVRAGETVALAGKDAWTGVKLTGFNPYGDKKSFYPTPLKFADWNAINVHSRGSDARQGAEEGTDLVRFDLAKIAKDAKIASAKLVLPIATSAGKKNAVQVFEVLVPWTDKVDWKTTDGPGSPGWQVEGCHGEKDKRKAGEVDIPDQKFDPKAPTELAVDVTALVKSWVSGGSPNNGIKFEMTGGYVNIAMKGFRLEITIE
jgi:hypothetical protein